MAQGFLGRVLDGRYRVVSDLGRGGMGSVYLATDERMDRQVVLKVPHQDLLQDAGFRQRFEIETRSLIELSHPHVVKVLDGGVEDDVPYLVLEYLAGGSLKDRIEQQGGQSTVAEVLTWLPYIAQALDHVHCLGVLHRDIKPGNILFDAHGNVFLADFGIAKALGPRDVNLTSTGMVAGTPTYMAPEAALEKPLDGRSDQYSLAAVVYRSLAGRVPIDGTSPIEIVVRKQKELPEPLTVEDLSSEGSAAVLRALARDPEERFPSCIDFVTALGAAPVATTETDPQATRSIVVTREPVPECADDPPPTRVDDEPVGPHTLESPDSDRPPTAVEPARTLPDGPAPLPSRRLVVLATVGAIVLLGAAAFALWGLPGKRLENPEPAPVPGPGPDGTGNRPPPEPSGPSEPEPAAETAEVADETGPQLEIDELPRKTMEETVSVRGRVDEDGCRVTVKGSPATVDGRRFEGLARLGLGPNEIEVVATDPSGNTSTTRVSIARTAPPDPLAPPAHALPYAAADLERCRRLIEGSAWSSPVWNEAGGLELVHVATKLSFVLLPSGSFRMGSDREPEEQPPHRVAVKALLMCRTECTQRAWRAGGGAETSKWTGETLPVETVAWSDAKAWCARNGLRLPTEAEWEYACRAGSTSAWSFGNEPSELADHGWTEESSGGRTHPVGVKKPNRWGLRDMHGNVWEWCLDVWRGDYIGSPTDGSARSGPAADGHVLRGGCWYYAAEFARSASRNAASDAGANRGFRPAADLPE
jgi:serine/threonine protein kinase